MFALLNPRVWIALAIVAALAFSHGFAFRSGSASMKAKWDAERAKQTLALADATAAARTKELALQRTKDEAVNAARKRETTLKADADRARDERDSLRNDADNLARILPSLADDAVRRYAATANVVLTECSRSYQSVAEKADGFASDTLMLQQSWPK